MAQIEQTPEIKLWSFTFGDNNDVFENKELKGTYKQVYSYCKSYFYRKRNVEDESDGTNIALIYLGRNENHDLTVEASEFEGELSEYKEFVDLTENEDD